MAHVLIVDDDLGYTTALMDGLGSLGYEVTGATTNAQAMEILEQYKIDAAIFDVIMHGGGAISLLHSVRLRGWDLPVIVATGRDPIATSPLFREGLRQATAKMKKSASLSEVDGLIRAVIADHQDGAA